MIENNKNKRLFKLTVQNEGGDCVVEGDANHFSKIAISQYDEFLTTIIAELLNIEMEIKWFTLPMP